MSSELLILILRLALVMVLYLFLWQLVAVIWRDLRRHSSPHEGSQQPVARLFVLDGGPTTFPPGHSFAVHGSTTIGRAPDNSIVLNDEFVSGSHAIINRRAGDWVLVDLGSRNGTSHNGKRIEGEATLRAGDAVGIGRVRMRFG